MDKQQRSERNSEIKRLYAKGWTMTEIANKIGISQQWVGKILGNPNSLHPILRKERPVNDPKNGLLIWNNRQKYIKV